VTALKPTGSAPAPAIERPEKAAPAQDPQQETLQAQVGRGLAAALRQNGGTVTLRLSPQELGDLKIRLHVEHGRVDARFEVTTQEAQAAVGDSFKQLRAALEARGLEVSRLDVQTVERRDPANPGGSDSGRDPDDSGPGFANQDHGAGGGDPGQQQEPGAERHRHHLGAQALGLPVGLDGRPINEASAEPDQQWTPAPAWIRRTGAGTSGGAHPIETGLDAIA
jgi:hypothetical protein